MEVFFVTSPSWKMTLPLNTLALSYVNKLHSCRLFGIDLFMVLDSCIVVKMAVHWKDFKRFQPHGSGDVLTTENFWGSRKWNRGKKSIVNHWVNALMNGLNSCKIILNMWSIMCGKRFEWAFCPWLCSYCGLMLQDGVNTEKRPLFRLHFFMLSSNLIWLDLDKCLMPS